MFSKRVICIVFVLISKLAWGSKADALSATSSVRSSSITPVAIPNPEVSVHAVESDAAVLNPESLKNESTNSGPDGSGRALALGLSSRAVPHDFFFTIIVQCPSWTDWIAMDQDPSHYPNIQGTRQTAERFKSERDFKMTMTREFTRCRRCKCDEEDDRTIIPDLTVRIPGVSRTGNYQRCHSYTVSDRCRYWHGCYCLIVMKQRDKNPEISIGEYQDALNNLPLYVKKTYPGYVWKSGGGFGMKWQYDTAYPPSSWFDSAGDKELVPGTDEPYYLEGPDKVPPEFSGPNAGLFGLPHQLLRSEFLKVKRGLDGGVGDVDKDETQVS
ncbi:hypothetical protein TWF506_009983 [Arthrobotrys conoides]|uniref:Uncharacterized protein n=1 Tax=Arthrobotrys conoides TaxID=74498 RepID=A0AAN8NM63_9PEZI